jgi:hypothetical protein
MAVTDADIQNIIILEVGDTVNNVLANNIAMFWSSYADKAQIAPRLQELYTQRRCIDAVMADPTFRDAVSFSMSGDLSLQLHERRDAMAKRRGEVQGQIDHIERWERQLQPPVVEQLKTKEIELPPALDPNPPNPTVLDANSPVYRGDPYYGTNYDSTGRF